MPRLPLLLRSAPLFVSANGSQIVSDANVGISGDSNLTIFTMFKPLALPTAATLVGFGDQAAGSHAGLKVRITDVNTVDVFITGIGSVPVSSVGGYMGNWRSVFVKKTAGSNPYLIGVDGRALNGGGTGAGNFTNAPLYLGANSGGTERLDGLMAFTGVWDSVLSDAELLALHRRLLAGMPAAAPKIFYILNESRVQKIKDSSPSGNDGTPTALQRIGGSVPGGIRGLVKYETALDVPGAFCLYEADQGITKDGSDRVSQWNDLTGNGVHLTQATGALQPLWVSNGINGKPALRTTQLADEFMSATNSPFRGGTRPHTLACVVKAESNGNSGFAGFFSIGSGGAGGNSSMLGHTNANKLWYGGAGLGAPELDTLFANGNTYVMVKVCNGRRDKYYLNGKMIGEATQLANYAITPVGDVLFGKYTTSYAGEDLLASFFGAWNRELNDGEVRGLMNTLIAKYGGGTVSARATVASGQRAIANVTGIPLTAATGTVTINDNDLILGAPTQATVTITDWTLMAGGSFDVVGMLTLTEGVDFDAEVSNEQTAQNFADALNDFAGEEIVVPDGASVTVTLGGEDDGGELTWSGAGVTPAVAVFSGGLDEVHLEINAINISFEDDSGIGVNANATASNLATYINGAMGIGCTALAVANVVYLTASTPGTAGNSVTLAVVGGGGGAISPDAVLLSGSTLQGGQAAVTARQRAIAT